ncbi:MAG: glycine cleavage system aminomethyltransferase GcvT [Syntrophomonadaceae bacterium]|nr:glycine cleavage system aminomethyltransferase GcvT [Syntrophomonadaceae bacterium]
MALKRTPLFESHIKAQGRMVDFGGWELPVQYQGILKEHEMVRTKAGLFDVSHMGEVIIKGEGAQDFIQRLVCNEVKKMADKQVLYSPMCYPTGGVVDDLLIYRYHPQHYLLVVNASNTDKDFAWIMEQAPVGLDIQNVSSQIAQLAVQGPLAQQILQELTDFDLEGIKFFWFEPSVMIGGVDCIMSRTGYTGEDGFELYVPNAQAPALWEKILTAGGERIAPIGLGARDSLRFEAKLPLYGQEMDQDITPLEAGLGFFVKLEGEDFIGRDALIKQKQAGLKRSQAEFRMVERGIPRAHYEVCKDGRPIGFVSSGLMAPTLGSSIGLALIDHQYNAPGETIDIMIRDKPVKAEIGKGIFYKKKTRQGQ